MLLLGWLGWSWWAGLAITAGLDRAQMDWNGDGVASTAELWQAFHAVTVSRSADGDRQCTTFSWRRSGEVIRVDCRTVFPQAAP